jgi:indole-3-glycerol phosphate synthase
MSILDTIVAEKRREIARLKANVVAFPAGVEARRRDFAAALRQPRLGEVALIAEVKKASPSAGVIRADFDAVSIAREYEAAGATCLSVLTDTRFFQGALEFLPRIRAAVSLPLLRKDFILEACQIEEAQAWGADAILLIAAILTDEQLRELLACARGFELAALVEVHDETELDRALAVGAELIGVNNRNLKTFTTDLATTERLAQSLWSQVRPNKKVLVAESGIHHRADVVRLARCGAQAILVGESLMRERDLTAKARELLGA